MKSYEIHCDGFRGYLCLGFSNVFVEVGDEQNKMQNFFITIYMRAFRLQTTATNSSEMWTNNNSKLIQHFVINVKLINNKIQRLFFSYFWFFWALTAAVRLISNEICIVIFLHSPHTSFFFLFQHKVAT